MYMDPALRGIMGTANYTLTDFKNDLNNLNNTDPVNNNNPVNDPSFIVQRLRAQLISTPAGWRDPVLPVLSGIHVLPGPYPGPYPGTHVQASEEEEELGQIFRNEPYLHVSWFGGRVVDRDDDAEYFGMPANWNWNWHRHMDVPNVIMNIGESVGGVRNRSGIGMAHGRDSERVGVDQYAPAGTPAGFGSTASASAPAGTPPAVM